MTQELSVGRRNSESVGIASVLRVDDSAFVSKVTHHESFRDHKLPFGPREIFSVTPSAILVEFDFNFGDRQIKFVIKRGTLPALAVCPGVEGRPCKAAIQTEARTIRIQTIFST